MIKLFIQLPKAAKHFFVLIFPSWKYLYSIWKEIIWLIQYSWTPLVCVKIKSKIYFHGVRNQLGEYPEFLGILQVDFLAMMLRYSFLYTWKKLWVENDIYTCCVLILRMNDTCKTFSSFFGNIFSLFSTVSQQKIIYSFSFLLAFFLSISKMYLILSQLYLYCTVHGWSQVRWNFHITWIFQCLTRFEANICMFSKDLAKDWHRFESRIRSAIDASHVCVKSAW